MNLERNTSPINYQLKFQRKSHQNLFIYHFKKRRILELVNWIYGGGGGVGVGEKYKQLRITKLRRIEGDVWGYRHHQHFKAHNFPSKNTLSSLTPSTSLPSLRSVSLYLFSHSFCLQFLVFFNPSSRLLFLET